MKKYFQSYLIAALLVILFSVPAFQSLTATEAQAENVYIVYDDVDEYGYSNYSYYYGNYWFYDSWYNAWYYDPYYVPYYGTWKYDPWYGSWFYMYYSYDGDSDGVTDVQIVVNPNGTTAIVVASECALSERQSGSVPHPVIAAFLLGIFAWMTRKRSGKPSGCV